MSIRRLFKLGIGQVETLVGAGVCTFKSGEYMVPNKEQFLI